MRFRRIGGLAGVLAAVLIIGLYPLFFLAPPFPTYGYAEVEQVLIRLSSPGLERTLFLLWQDISFVAALLFVFLFVALHRVLRPASPGLALAGTGLGLAGSVLLALSVLTARGALILADLYADASAADQATIVIVAETLDRLLVHGLVATSLVLLAVALIPFGLAMRGDSPYPRIYGTLTLALGAAVLILELVIPGAATTITNLPMIAWLLLAGLSVYRFSRG
ncbi:MAG: DUF4386 family protein [Thermoplasmata archaeon]